jgi:Carboxypeptidase regulatory-like domain/TonB dependent receptor
MQHSTCRARGLSTLLFFFHFLIILSPVELFAQSNGATISGRITDESDAVVQGVKVIATNLSQGQNFTTVSNEEGVYVLTELRPGEYLVTVERDGFRKVQLTGLTLEVQDAISRNFQLQVGAVSDSVVVAAGTDELGVSSAVSTVVDQQFVQNTPLNGRTFQSLLNLTPGFALAAGEGAIAGNANGQFSFNGQRDNANYITVDGVSANFSIQGLGQSIGGTIPALTIEGTTGGLVAVDAMQEFRVQTSNFTPDTGRTPGAQISIVTRSGGNSWHGTAFEYWRNEALDARNYFDATPLPKPPLRQNDFGGTLAGPILRDRLYFFFSYEGLQLLQPETVTGNFFTAAARAAVPASVLPYMEAAPLPNGPVNSDGITAPLTAASSEPFTSNSYSLRTDYNINDHVMLFARYAHSPSDLVGQSFSERASNVVETDSATLGITASLGPDKVNEFRFNWSYFVAGSTDKMIRAYGAIPPPPSFLAPPGYDSDSYSVEMYLEGSDGQISSGSGQNEQRQFEAADTFSMSVGTHQIRFGGDVRQLTPRSGQAGGNVLILSTYAQMQEGLAGFMQVTGYAPLTARLYNYSAFAQDVWRITPRFSLTYGLRWEINTPLGSISPGRPLYAFNGIFNTEPLAMVPVKTLWHTQFGNFAPRLGAVYQIAPQTIVRGAFGLFYDIGFGGGLAGTMTAYPYRLAGPPNATIPLDFGNPAFLPPTLPTTPVPLSTLNGLSLIGLDAVDPNLNLPLIYEWNAAVERGFGSNQSLTATYVGSHGTRLLRQDVFQNNLTGSPAVYVTHNADWSNYNALQLQFQRRMSRGLQVLASYAWAHSLDTSSSDVCGCTTTNNIHSVNPAADYASSTFDIRNSASLAFAYQIPWKPADRVKSVFLGNWGVYGIWRASSPEPYSVYSFGSSPVFGPYQTRADLVPGMPLYIPSSTQPNGRLLNPVAFVSPPPGQYGDSPRDGFRAYPIDQLDFALSKQFQLTDRISLDFRAEYFNIFNHPMFAPPWATFQNRINVPNLGGTSETLNEAYANSVSFSPVYEVGGPRSGQLSLKLQF